MLTKEQLLKEYKNHILPGPLNGIVVIGFCYYLAGPIALQNLVSQGCLVIKVERKPLGDPSRNVFSSNYFNSLAYNQLSIALDYDNEKDREFIVALLNIADAIVDNRSVRAKETDKILLQHFSNESKAKPQIYCSINGYPKEKIYNYPALDASIQASTGLAYTNCSSPQKPLKIGIPVLDQVTGLLASQSIIANLYLLLRFPSLPQEAKKMIYISVSMAGASMWLQTGQIIRTIEGKGEFLRSGNQDQFAVPFSYYTTQNGLLSVATVNEEQFKRFCLQVLKNSDFHSQYPTVQIRLQKQEQFEYELNELLKSQTREYWYALCQKFDIPASPVLTISEAIQQNFFQEILHESNDGKKVITQGISHSLFGKKKPAPAPFFGEHTQELSQLIHSGEKNETFIRSSL